MGVEGIARPRLDLGGDRADPEVGHLGAPAAVRADHVVVMSGLADDVGVPAVGQVNPFDESELLEELESPEDGRPSDPESCALRLSDEIIRREMAVALGNHLGHDTPRLGDEISSLVESCRPGFRVRHDQNDTQSLSELSRPDLNLVRV
jgi:hypothetical protein